MRSGFLVGAVLLGILLSETGPIGAQQSPGAADAFRDTAARALVLRAREARARDVEGMSSYEGLLREHIYVGLSAARFRRERGLFEQERVARVRWSADGERAIQWIGARQAVPIVGADTRRDEILAQGRMRGAGAEVQADLRRELPEELLGSGLQITGFALDPAGDRLAFGDDWALHPLADTAEAHYRFASGDTLRITLPDARTIVLQEIRVEPRRADFHLVAGSLWFDAESASLVRATYKPARPFDLLLDEPEDAEDVPGFLQPVEAEISYVTVEYSLQEFRYWLPRRFAMEGEARMGRVVRIPLNVEWALGDYRVNEATSDIPIVGPLPPGWSRREQRAVDDETGKVSYVTVLVPETSSLLTSSQLSQDFGQRSSIAFTDHEVDELRGELEALLPTYRRFRPQVSWGLSQGLTRFNRVEGLSTGVSATFPLNPVTSVAGEGRVGTGDRRPYGALTLTRGSRDREWSLVGFHRLQAMGDWANPFSFTHSAQNLLLGWDQGQYFRATGAWLTYTRVGQRTRTAVTAFTERHRPATIETDFFLLDAVRDRTPEPLFQADAVEVTGGRANLRWFRGGDPNAFIVSGQVLAEATVGPTRYRRAAATLAASHPLPGGLVGAVEFGGGALWGQAPLQRNFFIGGGSTLRGFDNESLYGPSFWRGRAELATGFAGARVVMFGDAGWAGSRDDFTLSDPWASVGFGSSFLDGLLRFDVARAVRRGSDWKVHLYLDGLF
ncbi:MAG TPA: hypothetical protein VLA36_03790 [Longimicrobiales bacterium]|nr:hypothetical protein [Longimicrobiales bacterium]